MSLKKYVKYNVYMALSYLNNSYDALLNEKNFEKIMNESLKEEGLKHEDDDRVARPDSYYAYEERHIDKVRLANIKKSCKAILGSYKHTELVSDDEAE